jgi:hypothetical protein
MSLETVLLLAIAAMSAAALVCVVLLRGEVRALRARLDATPDRGADGGAGEGATAGANPRLATARKAAAARVAKRPGRTTVKRV